MKVLFWNTYKNENINPYIVSLVQEHNVDVLIVAEYVANEGELGNMFKASGFQMVSCNTFGCKRINVWSNYIDVQAANQNEYYSIQILPGRYILCGVHLMTDMYGEREEERLALSQQIIHDIKEVEEKIDSQKTIIIGDFNEMPYGKSCLNANGFHGLPVLSVDDSSTRSVNGIEYKKFYNPMWNLMGDFSYPPGTYYLNQSKLKSPMWYMLDQIIMSKELLPDFKRESLKIITTCRISDLADRAGHPNKKISDHFPIICEIKNRKDSEG